MYVVIFVCRHGVFLTSLHCMETKYILKQGENVRLLSKLCTIQDNSSYSKTKIYI